MHTFKDASKTSALHSLSFGHTSCEIQKLEHFPGTIKYETLPISHHLNNDILLDRKPVFLANKLQAKLYGLETFLPI